MQAIYVIKNLKYAFKQAPEILNTLDKQCKLELINFHLQEKEVGLGAQIPLFLNSNSNKGVELEEGESLKMCNF